MLRSYARKLKHKTKLIVFRFRNLRKETFACPVCGYRGPFMDLAPPTGLRKHAQCPNCNALERHRIQFLVVNETIRSRNTTSLKMLHFAPEPFFRELFSRRFGTYETADLSMEGVNHNVDLQQLPFADATYDFVFASHVLEQRRDNESAISEIRRI